ncbi:unnamed protein product, partial [Didymodactylos carnosus]
LLLPSGLVSIKEESKYKRHAKILLPMFRKAKIVPYRDIIVQCTNKIIQKWHKNKGEPARLEANLVEQCQQLLLNVIICIAFDPHISEEQLQQLSGTVNEFAQHTYAVPLYFGFLPDIITKLYLKLNWKYQQVLKTLHEYENEPIDKGADGIEKTNLLSLMLSSLDETEQHGLSKEEIMDEILLLIFAGYETTSTALSWFIYYMSKYPQVQMKIKQELKQYDDTSNLDQLVYVDCVIKEVLRYAPIIDSTARVCEQNDSSFDGIEVRKGDTIIIPLQNLHRDPRYWKLNPNEFLPERFLTDDKDHQPMAMIPFGAGHRQCAGQDLARYELKVIVVQLMKSVTFIDGGEQMNSGGYSQQLVVTPRHLAVYIQFDQ